ncbi:MAG: hypothetical protein GYA24_25185, partial [Candidatus Lokiarchaeota archaeon]|nr:hypothetical protein [Candidatus Lokiarchaeota archaeon]
MVTHDQALSIDSNHPHSIEEYLMIVHNNSFSARPSLKYTFLIFFMLAIIASVQASLVNGQPGLQVDMGAPHLSASGATSSHQSPIVVIGNADLDLATTAGDGTSWSPFIVTVHGLFNTTAITIKNTNAHAIIQDCSITGNLTGTVPGISLTNCTNIRIENVSISGFKSGISVNRCSGLWIWNASTTRCATGISISGSSSTTITAVSVTRCSQRGAVIEGTSDSITIEKSVFISTSQAIAIIESTKNHVDGNTITGCTSGIYVEFGHENQIINNVIQRVHSGVRLSTSHQNQILSNRIVDCTGTGIHLHASNYNVVKGNAIHSDDPCSDEGMGNLVANIKESGAKTTRDIVDPIMIFTISLGLILVTVNVLMKGIACGRNAWRSRRSTDSSIRENRSFPRWVRHFKWDYSIEKHAFITTLVPRKSRSGKARKATMAIAFIGMLAFIIEIFLQVSSVAPSIGEIVSVSRIGSSSNPSNPVVSLGDPVFIEYNMTTSTDIYLQITAGTMIVYKTTRYGEMGVNTDSILLDETIFWTGDFVLSAYRWVNHFLWAEYSLVSSKNFTIIRETSRIECSLDIYPRVNADGEGYFDCVASGKLRDDDGVGGNPIMKRNVSISFFDEAANSDVFIGNATTDLAGQFTLAFQQVNITAEPAMATCSFAGDAVYTPVADDAYLSHNAFHKSWQAYKPFSESKNNTEPEAEYLLITKTSMSAAFTFETGNDGWTWTATSGSPYVNLCTGGSAVVYEYSNHQNFAGFFQSERLSFPSSDPTRVALLIDLCSDHVISGDPDRLETPTDTFTASVEIRDYQDNILMPCRTIGAGDDVWFSGDRRFALDLSDAAFASAFGDPIVFTIRVYFSIVVGQRNVGFYDGYDTFAMKLNSVHFISEFPPVASGFLTVDGLMLWLATQDATHATGSSYLGGNQEITKSTLDGSVYTPLTSGGQAGLENGNFNTNPYISTGSAFLNRAHDGFNAAEGTDVTDLYSNADVSTASVSYYSVLNDKQVLLKLWSVCNPTGARWASLSVEFTIENKPGYSVKSTNLWFTSNTVDLEFSCSSGDSYTQSVYIERASDGFGAPVASLTNGKIGSRSGLDVTARAGANGTYCLAFVLSGNDWCSSIAKLLLWYIDNIRVDVTYTAMPSPHIDAIASPPRGITMNIARPVAESTWSGSLLVGSSIPVQLSGTLIIAREQNGYASDGVGTSLVELELAGAGSGTFTLAEVTTEGSVSVPFMIWINSSSTNLNWTVRTLTSIPASSPDGMPDLYHGLITGWVAREAMENGSWLNHSVLTSSTNLRFRAVTAPGTVTRGSNAINFTVTSTDSSTNSNQPFSATIVTPSIMFDLEPTEAIATFTLDYVPFLRSSTVPPDMLATQSGNAVLSLVLYGDAGGDMFMLTNQTIDEITIDSQSAGITVRKEVDFSRWMTRPYFFGKQFLNFSLALHVRIVENCSRDGVEIGIRASGMRFSVRDLATLPRPHNFDSGSAITGPAQPIVVLGIGDGVWCLFNFFIDGQELPGTARNDSIKGLPEVWATNFNATRWGETDNLTIMATICDRFGQRGSRNFTGISIDLTAPTVTLLNISSNAVVGAPRFVDIACSSDVVKAVYQVVPSGQSWTGPGVITIRTDTERWDGFGFHWQIYTLLEGMYDFRVLVYDRAGLMSVATVTSVLVELLDPIMVESPSEFDGNGRFVAVSSSEATTRATLSWAVSNNRTYAAIPAAEWIAIDQTVTSTNDQWTLLSVASDFPEIDADVHFRIQFEVPGGYHESCYASSVVDTTIPQPILGFAAGSEPGAGSVFTNVSALNFTMAGGSIDDLARLVLGVASTGSPYRPLRTWLFPAPDWQASISIFELPFDDVHTFTATVTDDVGNVANSSVTVVIDNESPVITIYSPREGEHVSINKSTCLVFNTTVQFYSHVNDLDLSSFTTSFRWVGDAGWTTFSSPISSIRQGHYQFPWSIDNASIHHEYPVYEIKINAVDVHGRSYIETTFFTIDDLGDEIAPTITLSQPSTSTVWGPNPVFDFTVTDNIPNGTVLVEVWSGTPLPPMDQSTSSNLVARLTPVPGGQYHVEVKDTAFSPRQGLNTFTIRAFDQLGNIATRSITITCSLPIANITSGATYRTRPLGDDLDVSVYSLATDMESLRFLLESNTTGSWTTVSNTTILASNDWIAPLSLPVSGQYRLTVTGLQNASLCGRPGNWIGLLPPTIFFVDDRAPGDLRFSNVPSGSVLSGIVTIMLEADDPSGLSRARFFVDGQEVLAQSWGPITWNSLAWDDGAHQIFFECTDWLGNSANSTPVSIYTDNSRPVIATASIAPVAYDSSISTKGLITIVVNATENISNITRISVVLRDTASSVETAIWTSHCSNMSVSMTRSIQLAGLVPPGRYLAWIEVESGAGVRRMTEQALVFDPTAPAGSFILPAMNSICIDGRIDIRIAASDAFSSISSVEVFLSNPSIAASSGITCFLDISTNLYHGSIAYKTNYTGPLYARLVDALGNAAIISSPSVVLVYPGDALTSLHQASLLGSPVVTTGFLPASISGSQVTVELAYHSMSSGSLTWVPVTTDIVDVAADGGVYVLEWDTDALVGDSAAQMLPVSIATPPDSSVIGRGLAGTFLPSYNAVLLPPTVATLWQSGSSISLDVFAQVVGTSGRSWARVTATRGMAITTGSIHAATSGDIDGDGLDEMVAIITSTVTGSNIVQLMVFQADATNTITVWYSPVSTYKQSLVTGNDPYYIAIEEDTKCLYIGHGEEIVRLHYLWTDTDVPWYGATTPGDVLPLASTITGMKLSPMDGSLASPYYLFVTAGNIVARVTDFNNDVVSVIDTVPGSIKTVGVGEISGDEWMDVVVGIEMNDGRRLLAGYTHDGAGTWRSHVIRDHGLIAQFSSAIEVGFILSSNPFGDIVSSTSTSGVVDYQLEETVVETTVSVPGLTAACSTTTVPGTLTARDGILADTLPITATEASEHYDVARSDFTFASGMVNYDADTVTNQSPVGGSVQGIKGFALGNSFTATRAEIDSVKVYVRSVLSGAGLDDYVVSISIHPYVSGIPQMDNPVALKSISFSTFTRGRNTTFGWTSIDINVPNLMIGDKYILAFSTEKTVNEAASFEVGATTGNAYAQGECWIATSGTNWAPYTPGGYDIVFEVEMYTETGPNTLYNSTTRRYYSEIDVGSRSLQERFQIDGFDLIDTSLEPSPSELAYAQHDGVASRVLFDYQYELPSGLAYPLPQFNDSSVHGNDALVKQGGSLATSTTMYKASLPGKTGRGFAFGKLSSYNLLHAYTPVKAEYTSYTFGTWVNITTFGSVTASNKLGTPIISSGNAWSATNGWAVGMTTTSVTVCYPGG